MVYDLWCSTKIKTEILSSLKTVKFNEFQINCKNLSVSFTLSESNS